MTKDLALPVTVGVAGVAQFGGDYFYQNTEDMAFLVGGGYSNADKAGGLLCVCRQCAWQYGRELRLPCGLVK